MKDQPNDNILELNSIDTALPKGHGYTTGSCATAAAKAATYALLSGNTPSMVTLTTPKGIVLDLEIHNMVLNDNSCSCAIIKNSGDDPDITNGAYIYAKAEKINETSVLIEGGEGVGKVTIKGLDIEVGQPAINKTPLGTITHEVKAIMQKQNYSGGIKITISVPNGVELAKKTYNSRLGILGGISIIGTTGIVEPMSTKALIDTIRAELKMVRANGANSIIITPGNYGRSFIEDLRDAPDKLAVKAGNYIGEAMLIADSLGFENILLIGNIGKFIKVAGGIFNTHSNNADCRLEVLAAAAIRANADNTTLNAILDCITAEDAISLLSEKNLLEQTMSFVIERFDFYTKQKLNNANLGGIIFSNRHGLLVKSASADEILLKIKKNERF